MAKPAAGEDQRQIDAGVGVGTPQTAAKEHHRLVQQRTPRLLDTAERIQKAPQHAHLGLLDPPQFRDFFWFVAVVGETVRFVSHSGQIRHDMECGNIKCDAAGRIGLECQPDQFPHQLRLLHHPIFVINIGRLWIRNHRLGPILPLAQALKPQFQFADARKILIEPTAIAAAGPPLQPARFVEHQIEHASPRLDPPQRGGLLGRGPLHKQGPVESPDARLCRDRHPRSGDRQNVRKRSAVLHAEVERGKPGFVADPLRGKLIERLRVAKILGQRIWRTG